MLLTEAHTSLNDVDDIVAKFLALVDDVHIDGTDGVSIFVVVHIGNILRILNERLTSNVSLRPPISLFICVSD